ncbi:GDSL-like Lipase/Acylhydrolase family protein [Methylobacterium sp. UNC378MF]|uniref:SGNH/GDSL hydrolase family protein n=1 Tax=Methylobacterium sp. UNC378MF TaxID=1502748 RepID=UPI00088D405A|nr:SGNH/GDSL hydrolase family protein [Methylobacterium sp. UNC378MF]SDA15828.1 GDSL-like Lipase/Acylhydrolase family protein [Methylobacterium sp. UNC378MF]
MAHVVLLGDSVFDNAAYVGVGPEVVQQLRSALPDPWQATRLAVDGNVTADVRRQLGGIPPNTTHLVVSVGGNDALRASGVLERTVRSVADALGLLAEVRERFQAEYAAMLDAVRSVARPTALCTIYDPRYPDPQRRLLASTALTLLNDVITREAFARGLDILDLRVLCSENADFANPIEPSVQGGRKIAEAIRAFVEAQPEQRDSRVFARVRQG